MLFKSSTKEELRVRADMNNLGKLRDFVVKIGRRYGFSDKVVGSLKLCMDEACTNIIRHAYRDMAPGDVTVRAIVKASSLTICIIDQGKTFDPRRVKPPDLKEYIKIGKKGGLGIFMMQKLMDEIDYHVTAEGNELRLIKNRDTAQVQGKFWWARLSLKKRYAGTAGIVLTAIFVLWVFFYQNIQSNRTKDDVLKRAQAIAVSLSLSSAEYLEDRQDIPVFKLLHDIKNNEETKDLVVEAFVTDLERNVFALTDLSEGTLGKYTLPEDYEIVELEQSGTDTLSESEAELVARTSVYYYRKNDLKQYEVATPIIGPDSRQPIGISHITIPSKIIEDSFSGIFIIVMIISAGVLAIGYLGIMFLVTKLISPFQKLTEWIRSSGYEGVDDDVDIDTSNEVGEIALAFSDMSVKFKKAQIGLVQQKELQKEIQVAQDIQHMLLPSKFPEIEGYSIATYYEAAKEVGGDLYDFVLMDEDTMGLAVADVSGKGIPGSLVMTMIRTALKFEGKVGKSAAKVLANVNSEVARDMKKGMFVTMFYVILDSRNRIIRFSSAGHNPMILYRSKTKKTYYLNPRGFPVGIVLPDPSLFEKSIEEDSIKLQEGDILIMYTDGITEAMNPERELFGDERFLETIRKYGHLPVEEFLRNLKNDILEFTKGHKQNDDITLFAINEKLKADEVIFKMRKELLDLAENQGYSVKDACKKMRVSTSTYYKYKKRFEKYGDEGLKDVKKRSDTSIKHLSIEERAQLFEVIRTNPELGPRAIAKELDTEKYEHTKIPERKIYDELIRMKLNTQERREAFVKKKQSNKRFKLPGTPLLTMDGQVIKMEQDGASIVDQMMVKTGEPKETTQSEQ